MSENVARWSYIGQYTIPRNVSLSAAAVVGQLHFSGIESPLVSADNPLVIDSLAPHLTFCQPRERRSSRKTIVRRSSPAMSDLGGTGVSADAVRLTLDGVDVTKSADDHAVFPVLDAGSAIASRPASSQCLHGGPLREMDRTTAWQFTVEPPNVVQSFSQRCCA